MRVVDASLIHGQYEDASAHGVYIAMCYGARYFIAHLRKTNDNYVRLGKLTGTDNKAE